MTRRELLRATLGLPVVAAVPVPVTMSRRALLITSQEVARA